MSSNGTSLVVDRLPAKQLSALKRKASLMGVAPQEYVRQLISRDLELDRIAQAIPLEKLAEPFVKAFKGVSEETLDRLVDEARTRHREAGERKRRRRRSA